MVGDARQNGAKVERRVQSAELGRADECVEGCGTFSAGIGAEEQVILPSDRDSPDILPMSVRNWRFTILGIRFTGEKFVIEIASNAAQVVLFTWMTALAWSRWSPHGCWIR